MQVRALLFVPVVDERMLWVFLVRETVGTGLQTRDLLESHVLTVTNIAGYKISQMLVLSFSNVPLCRLQISAVIWRSPLLLISISSIKEKLCWNSAVVSICITQLVTVVICFLQVVGGASDALLKEEEWLFWLQTVW